MPRTPTTWRPGDVVDDTYEIREVIASGGMGLVYRAHHGGWGVDLAVKVPKLSDVAALERFEAEAETWVGLGMHPHCVSCAYVRRLDGVPCVFSEWVDGGDLARQVASRRLYGDDAQTSLARILDVAIQSAWGLAHAHRNGMVHQDVKPANLMLADNGAVKVTDFGLSKVDASIADPGNPTVSVAGRTLAYCSPEQYDGAATLTPATDAWSWALSVLEMFYGETPTAAGHAAGQALAELARLPTEEPRIPALPDAVADVLRDCFHPDPHRRAADMSTLADRLTEIYVAIVGTEYPNQLLDAAELLADELSNRALSFIDLGDPARAGELWTEALAVDPHHPQTVYNQGVHQWRVGQITDVQLIERLEELRQTQADQWIDEYLLGLVHLERGAAQPARELLSAAADQAPDVEEVATALAIAQARPAPPAIVECRGHDETVATVAFSLDGTRAASGSRSRGGHERPESECGTVRVWDTGTGTELTRIKAHRQRTEQVALNRDGTIVASCGDGSPAAVWRVDTGVRLCEFTGHDAPVRGVALSPDGRLAATADESGGVVLWDARTGQPRHRLVSGTHGHGYRAELRFSADGSRLLWQDRVQRLRIWQTATGFLEASMPTHGAYASLTHDGSIALLQGQTHCELWSLTALEPVHSLPRELPRDGTTAVGGDGEYAVTATGGRLAVWSTATGRCLHTVRGDEPIAAVAVSPDGTRVITGGWDGTVRVSPMPRPGPTGRGAYARPRDTLALARQSRLAATSTAQARSLLAEGDWWEASELLRRVRDLPGLARDTGLEEQWAAVGRFGIRRGLRGARLSRTFAAGSTVLSPDGTRVLVGRGFRHDVAVHDCVGTTLAELGPHGNIVYDFAVSEDASAVVTGSQDRQVRLWDTDGGRLLRTFTGHAVTVSAVAVNPQRNLVASADWDRELKLWDTASGRCRSTIADPYCRTEQLDFTADGTVVVATMADGSVRLWDTETATVRAAFDARGIAAVSHDGRRVLAAAPAASLSTWDAVGGFIGRSLLGHTAAVTAVSISADGRRGRSASRDGTIRVWNLDTGECERVVSAHDGEVTAMAVLPDERFAVSSGTDGAVRIWDLETGAPLWNHRHNHPGPPRPQLSGDGRRLLLYVNDTQPAQLWTLDWDFEFTAPSPWDDRLVPYLSAMTESLHGRPPGDTDVNLLHRRLRDAGLGRIIPEVFIGMWPGRGGTR